MHRRCCWPPDRPSGGAQGALHDVVQLGVAADAVGPGPVGHVVINAHGEGVGLLKHHADALAQQGGVHPGVIDILSVEVHLALDLHGGNQVVHAVQSPQERGFAAAGGADKGGDLPLRNGHGHIVEGVIGPVPQVQALGLKNRFHKLPHFFRSFRPTREADRLISRVSTIRMVAMEKARAVSPRSVA